MPLVGLEWSIDSKPTVTVSFCGGTLLLVRYLLRTCPTVRRTAIFRGYCY